MEDEFWKRKRKRAIFIFVETLKIRRFVSLHYIFPNKLKHLATEIFHCLKLITAILRFPKILILKKSRLNFFSISQNLQENQSLKDYTFSCD